MSTSKGELAVRALALLQTKLGEFCGQRGMHPAASPMSGDDMRYWSPKFRSDAALDEFVMEFIDDMRLELDIGQSTKGGPSNMLAFPIDGKLIVVSIAGNYMTCRLTLRDKTAGVYRRPTGAVRGVDYAA